MDRWSADHFRRNSRLQGYHLRRLATRRAKFFPAARDELLRQVAAWPPLPSCAAAAWSVRLLNASALADGESTREFGEGELAVLVREILTSQALLGSLSSQLGLFGLLAFAGRRKKRPRELSPVIWDDFTELAHWSKLQTSLWKAVRTRRPLPLSAVVVQLIHSSERLEHVVSLLAAAQEIRLRSEILSASQLFAEIQELVQPATDLLSAWAAAVTLPHMIKGLRDWPVVQLLADLEVSDLAEVQAMGRQLPSQHMVRFLPSPQA